MFEKKIKKFFDSVSVCGEKPTQKIKKDKHFRIILGTTAGILSAALGAGLTIYFIHQNKSALYSNS